MRERPLCVFLFIFLLVQSMGMIWKRGQTLVEVPAYSIFFHCSDEAEIVLKGQVYRKEIKEKYQILYLKNNSITNQEHIIVYEDTFQDIKIGQYVELEGTISLFQGPANPGNFDAKLYYAKQKIYGSVWCSDILKVSGATAHLKEGLFQIRQTWKEMLLNSMGQKNGAILCAMLLNEKDEMNPETKELYQANGYSHILAISGLHISFVGLGCYRILRKIGAGYAAAGFFSIGLLLLYVIMLGFSVSIFRAFLMLMFRIGADVTGRVYDMLTAVTLSAALLVLYEPLYLADAAFQLSHGAIYAILYVKPAMKRWIKSESLAVSLAINITLFPITIWWFYEVAVYGSIWNLLVIPLVSSILTLGMFGSILPFKTVWFSISSCIFEVFELIGNIGNQLPGNRLVLGRPAIVSLVLFYLWLIFFTLSSRKERISGKLFVGTFFLVLLSFIDSSNGELELTMLDVGQGDCIYVEGPDGTDYLFDGGSSDVAQVGKYRIESYLKYEGVGSIDYVFVSHGDKDHYNGIEEMLSRQAYGVKIKNLIFPEIYKKDKELEALAKLAKENGTNISYIEQGAEFEKGGIQIRCLHPGMSDIDLEGNAGSMVLDVSYKKFSLLLTGDVEAEGEERLLKHMGERTYQVLKVSHHGSKNATSERFLSEVRPVIALISVGRNNSYGHPHEETLERLRNAGSHIFVTSSQGAITLKTDGNSLTF